MQIYISTIERIHERYKQEEAYGDSFRFGPYKIQVDCIYCMSGDYFDLLGLTLLYFLLIV
jgi:hypothetical protein